MTLNHYSFFFGHGISIEESSQTFNQEYQLGTYVELKVSRWVQWGHDSMLKLIRICLGEGEELKKKLIKKKRVFGPN